MAAGEAVNLAKKAQGLESLWTPHIVAQMNDYDFKVARVEGVFVWHSHPETDEAFLVLEGSLDIELRDATVTLGPGDLYVVPRGVEHRPVAVEECRILLIEPTGTANTGDVGGERTASVDLWA